MSRQEDQEKFYREQAERRARQDEIERQARERRDKDLKAHEEWTKQHNKTLDEALSRGKKPK